MVEIARRETERVKLAAGRQQHRGRSLLTDDARVAALPLAHHVDAAAAAVARPRGRGRRSGRLVREAERVAAERRACSSRKFPNSTFGFHIHSATVRIMRILFLTVKYV